MDVDKGVVLVVLVGQQRPDVDFLRLRLKRLECRQRFFRGILVLRFLCHLHQDLSVGKQPAAGVVFAQIRLEGAPFLDGLLRPLLVVPEPRKSGFVIQFFQSGSLFIDVKGSP